MSNLRQKPTAVVQYLSPVAQDPSEDISRFKIWLFIATISMGTYLAWSNMTQLPKQKKRPTPITTRHTATIDAEQITPQDQIDRLKSEHLGHFAPRYSNLTDSSLDRMYQDFLRQDLSINANSSEPEKSDPDYDILRCMTQM